MNNNTFSIYSSAVHFRGFILLRGVQQSVFKYPEIDSMFTGSDCYGENFNYLIPPGMTVPQGISHPGNADKVLQTVFWYK